MVWFPLLCVAGLSALGIAVVSIPSTVEDNVLWGLLVLLVATNQFHVPLGMTEASLPAVSTIDSSSANVTM